MPERNETPIATITVKNRGNRPFLFKRTRNGVEVPLSQLGAIGLRLYQTDAFISIDLESGVIWVDGFEP